MGNTASGEILEVMSMNRDQVIDRLLHFSGSFDFDFSAEYLESLGNEQLQHMLVAAYLHAYKPEPG